MTSRGKIAIGCAIFALALIVLTIATAGYWLNLGDSKTPRVFPMAGTSALTDEQAMSIARQVLVLDGRDLTNLQFEDGPDVEERFKPQKSISADGSTLFCFRDRKTNWQWFVNIRREPGKVTGESSHGL